VRAGTAWDQTPVPSARYRTARIPDSDRVWASLGLGYQLFEWARVDLSYAHVFGMKVSTTNRDPVTGHELRGTFEGGADIVGVQASLRLW
jgi:long-chain fatty acid transport protein